MFTPGVRTVRTVFLDRDGTINVKPPEGAYITSAAELSLLPGAARAVAELNVAGLRIILVTNQRWLSGPLGNPACYAAIHARLEQLLAAQGAWLDAAYYCPHAIATCDCRKPGAGMLRRAADEHRFNLADAVMIGDSDADMAAGRSAGTATILLRGGEGSTSPSADAVVDDLPAAARLILAGGFSQGPALPVFRA
jgi:D-glycero-D-manno-heptose 1,7-bisphosphate phosphatase